MGRIGDFFRKIGENRNERIRIRQRNRTERRRIKNERKTNRTYLRKMNDILLAQQGIDSNKDMWQSFSSIGNSAGRAVSSFSNSDQAGKVWETSRFNTMQGITPQMIAVLIVVIFLILIIIKFKP